MVLQESAQGGTISTPIAGYQSDYPAGATPVTSSSGNVANAPAAATLPAAANKTTYISGFVVTGTGVTLALNVAVALTGITGGTATFIYTFITGAILANTPLVIPFAVPIPASAPNTAISVTCPAGGLGAANNAVMAYGYQL